MQKEEDEEDEDEDEDEEDEEEDDEEEDEASVRALVCECLVFDGNKETRVQLILPLADACPRSAAPNSNPETQNPKTLKPQNPKTAVTQPRPGADPSPRRLFRHLDLAGPRPRLGCPELFGHFQEHERRAEVDAGHHREEDLVGGETVILLHLPLCLVGVLIAMDRRRQQNDCLADGAGERAPEEERQRERGPGRPALR